MSRADEQIHHTMTQASSQQPWYVQMAVAVGLAAAMLVALVWGYALVKQIQPPYEHREFCDFVQEWTSGRNHFAGRPIYDDMRRTVPIYLDASPPPLVAVNAHPPVSVLMLLPLARLEFDAALFNWHLVSLAALAISLMLIGTVSGIRYSAAALFPAALLLVTSAALGSQLSMGQFNLVLLLLIVLAWAADRAEYPLVAGAFVGAAAAIKLFPAFLFLYFLVRRRWTALAAGAVVFAGLNGVAAFVLGTECYRDYVLDVMPQVGAYRDFWTNSSFAGFWSKLLDAPSGHEVPLWKNPAAAKVATLISWILVVAMTTRTIARAGTRDQRDRAFTLCVIAMLLVSPITWDHYFLLLILPIAVLWKILPHRWWARGFLLVAVVLLGTINPGAIWNLTIAGGGEFAMDPFARSVAEPWQTLTVLSYQFYALLALFVFTWSTRLRQTDIEQQSALSQRGEAA